MFLHRVVPYSVVVLSAALAGWQAAGAEPTDPIPEVARDRYAEAQRLEKEGKLEEAVAAYQQAIRLGMKDYPRVYLRQAAVYERLGDYAAAAAKYSVVIDVLGLEGSCRD
jgi:tetratricopeptide (TPR) repeat protein